MRKNSVLILGASSAVAKEIAYAYAAKKYDLLLSARNIIHAEQLSRDIEIRYQVSCQPVRLDINEIKDHNAIVEGLPFLPSICVCLVGLLGDHDKALHDGVEVNQILLTNFNGVVSVLELLARKYEQSKSGILAVFSSVAGDRGRQSNYYYGSAKAALTAYLSGLRNRLVASNVHVLTIKPGFMDTKMTQDLDLPKLLTASPVEVAKATLKAIERKKNVVYIKWFWRYIMLVIKLIPEGIFKKLKL